MKAEQEKQSILKLILVININHNIYSMAIIRLILCLNTNSDAMPVTVFPIFIDENQAEIIFCCQDSR